MSNKQQIIELKKKVIKLGAICFIFALVFGAAFYYKSKSEEEYNKAKRQVDGLRGSISKKEREFSDAEDSLKQFLLIKKNKLPTTDGYSAGYMRIREIIPTLEKLDKIYKLRKTEFSMENLNISNRISSQIFGAYENELNITFKGASDELVLAYVERLAKELPGYLQLNHFSFAKKAQINNSTINQYKNDKKFAFVMGDAGFSWVTLKSKK